MPTAPPSARRLTVRLAVHCARLIAAASLLASLDAAGFTFSDGTTARCTAAGNVVPEIDVSQGEEKVLFTGKVVAEGNGYRMLWNMEKLNTLPAEMHDYLFFHECAHARLPTRDETQANCAGLIEMRASGKAGPDIESKIAAFYGPGSAYWTRTLQCANKGAPDARQPASPAPP